MNSIQRLCPLALVACVAALSTAAVAHSENQAQQRHAAMVGGMLPGGAVLSAKLVSLAPVGAGEAASAALGADGSFGFEGLAPGRYQLSLRLQPVPKQTQAPSFGERRNAGAAQDAAAASDTAQNSVSAVGSVKPGGLGGGASSAAYARMNGGMPNRISMNVTVARRTLAAEVDGPAVEVEVGADGKLSGLARAATVAAPNGTPGNWIPITRASRA
jgi:hypothetical protein